MTTNAEQEQKADRRQSLEGDFENLLRSIHGLFPDTPFQHSWSNSSIS